MHEQFFEHSYHRTYYWAGLISAVLEEPLAYAEEMEGLFSDRGVLGFTGRFEKYSALHKFAEFWIDHSFYNDSCRRGLVPAPSWRPAIDPYDEDRVLPVEQAMLTLGLDYGERTCDTLRRLERYPPTRAPCNDDFYFDFFQELRLGSVAYESLLRRLSDEVFFVLFLNRGLLANLNGLLAWELRNRASGYLRPLRSRASKRRRLEARRSLEW